MGAMVSQITSLMIVYSTVYSRRRSKKASKLRVTGLCEGNSPMTGELPAQNFSNAEKVSSWRHINDDIFCETVGLSKLYRQTFNISRIVVGNKIVDHSDVVAASPVDPAPTTSSFPT